MINEIILKRFTLFYEHIWGSKLEIGLRVKLLQELEASDNKEEVLSKWIKIYTGIHEEKKISNIIKNLIL